MASSVVLFHGFTEWNRDGYSDAIVFFCERFKSTLEADVHLGPSTKRAGPPSANASIAHWMQMPGIYFAPLQGNASFKASVTRREADSFQRSGCASRYLSATVATCPAIMPSSRQMTTLSRTSATPTT